MARTPNEVKQDMIKTIEEYDPTIEVDRGPIHDSVLVPTSSEISNAETRVDKLDQLYSTDFIKGATLDEVNAYVTNFALKEGNGKKAKCSNMIFATLTPLQAGETLVIPLGTLVSNADQTLIYRTTEEKAFFGDTMTNYYNAVQGWYEIVVPVEAVAVGTQYNIPAERIRKLLSNIQGIDYVTNRSKADFGTEPEDINDSYNRVIKAFQGQDKGSIGGIASLVQDYNPDAISDVIVVQSKDRALFKRFVSQLALDIYIIGVEGTSTTEEFTLPNNSYYVTPSIQPLLSVSEVIKNGVQLNSTEFFIEKDTDEYFFDSTKAQDRIGFTTELLAGDIVTVSYTYNSLLTEVQSNVFGEDNLFDMDILVRQIISVPLSISATIKVSSSSNKDKVLSDVESELISLIENNQAGYTYTPEAIKQQLIDNVTGLRDIIWQKFSLTDSSTLDVQVVELQKNQIAIINEDDFLLR